MLQTVNKPIVTPLEGNCVMDVRQLLIAFSLSYVFCEKLKSETL